MNDNQAQMNWKELYELFTDSLSFKGDNLVRENMCRYRREAALERQIAAQQRRIETLQEIYRSDHDERIRQEECIKQLQSEIDYLRSTDHAVDMAMERQHERRDQLDGWSDETPLGIALDGLGDSVE